MIKVVTIGGGTGSHTVLSGLKKYPIDLTAIVTVADSGGSTGRLRDEFGYLPVGDFRMALTALASSEEEAQLLRELFLYRFDKGEKGLKGHNFGNLFIVAMADIMGSYDRAIEYTSKILNVKGRVLPITSEPIDLHAKYEDDSELYEEANIDEPPENHDGKLRIEKLWVEPDVPIAKKTSRAILEADYIVLGPGDLYTSIFPNLIVKGTKTAIEKSGAKVIYIENLMTKYGQTWGYTAKNHVEEVKNYLGRYPDYVLINSEELPERILEDYKLEHDFPVEDDLEENNNYKIIREDILVPEKIKKVSGDLIKRSLLRHDPDKLAWEIIKIIGPLMTE